MSDEVPGPYRRLTYLLTSLNMGGAQAQAVRLAGGFVGRGWDVRLISMIPAEAFTEELDELGVPWTSLGMAPGSADPRGVLRLRRLIRRWGPTFIHGHMVHANLLARVTRLTTRVPVVVSTAHSIDEGGRGREIAYRVTDPLSDYTTNVSQTAVDRYICVGAAPEHKIGFIPNGIDSERFAPDAERRARVRASLGVGEEFVWFAAGRMEKAKDYPNMLQAMARATHTNSGARLFVAGDGPDASAVKALAQELGVQRSVTFLGQRRDVPDLMNAADGYLMSSAWEGLPMVLLEAAASGLPIVATDVGGNHEVVADGVNGFVVPPADPGALAARMGELQGCGESERRAMGAAGRRNIATTYDLNSVLDRWTRLFAALLERRGLTGEPAPAGRAR